MSHSESESVFAPKLLSCVLLSSPDCLAGMEASHGVLQTVSEHLGGEGEEEEDSPTVIDREAIYLRRMLAATSDGGGRLSLPKGTEVSLEDVDEKDTFDEEEEDFMVKRQDRRRRGNSGGNQVRDSPFDNQYMYTLEWYSNRRIYLQHVEAFFEAASSNSPEAAGLLRKALVTSNAEIALPINRKGRRRQGNAERILLSDLLGRSSSSSTSEKGKPAPSTHKNFR